MRRVWGIVAVCIAAACVIAATWPRDDSGVPAPAPSFVDSSGTVRTTSATYRLPVETASEATGGSPTSGSTDALGYGQSWYTAQTATMPFTGPWLRAVSDNALLAYVRGSAATSVEVWQSTNRGATWTLRESRASSVTLAKFTAGLALANGDVLLGYYNSSGTTPSVTGLVRMSASGGNVQTVSLPGLPAGFMGQVNSLWSQGTTVLATWRRNVDSTTYRCRSTDSGSTFTCDSTFYNTTSQYTNQCTASPSASVWIQHSGGTIYRSTNDGVSWTTVSTTADTVSDFAVCADANTCFVVGGGTRIYRTSDGGVSWSLVYTAGGTNPGFQRVLSYGDGLAVALATSAGGGHFLTSDNGASWRQVFTTDANTRCLADNMCFGVVSAGGVAVYTRNATTATALQYSPTLAPGAAYLVGLEGYPLAINSNGYIGVMQQPGGTATSTSGYWWVSLTNGSSAVGAGGTPLQTSPVQGPTLFNSSTTGAANTAVTASIAAAAGVRAHLYHVSAYCSAGSASLTVVDGAATVWQTPTAAVGTTLFMRDFSVGLTGTTNSTMTVTLSACGVGNTGTLNVIADRF